MWGEEETGTIPICTGEKETMTVILQYLNMLFVLTFSWQKHKLYTMSSPASLRGNRGRRRWDEQEGTESVMAGVSSVRSWTEHWTRLDFENKNVKMAGNLVANTDTVTHQVKKGNDLQEREKHGQELCTLRTHYWQEGSLKKLGQKVLLIIS